MAGDWIKFELSTPDKPEVWAIAASLSIDPDAVVGKLLRVWGWFDQQTEDGTANKATKNMLDRLVGCVGFCDSVCSVGWMVIEQDSISLPDFDKHNGKTAKNRINTAKRVAAYKGRQKSNAEGNGKVTEKVTELTDRQTIPRPIRALIFERDKSTCVYCGRADGEYCPPETKRDAIMSVDHVIPITRQGSENIDNLVCACMSCNNFKNDRTPEEAGLEWPVDKDGNRYGSVTSPLPKEEKRREEKILNTNPSAQTPSDALDNPDPVEPEKPAKAKPEYPEWFEAIWSHYPTRAGGDNKRMAFQKAGARVKEGKSHQDLYNAVDRYKYFVVATGKASTEYVKQAATFFGSMDNINNLWTPPALGASNGANNKPHSNSGSSSNRPFADTVRDQARTVIERLSGDAVHGGSGSGTLFEDGSVVSQQGQIGRPDDVR